MTSSIHRKAAYFLPCLAALILLASCDASTEQPVEHKSESPTQNTSKQLADVKLSKENVEEVLLQYAAKQAAKVVNVHTSLGSISIKLYPNTPLHRANFLWLTERAFYNETQFYRVIQGFIVQGGDSDELVQISKKKKIGKYQVPAEFVEGYWHKTGAVSAARHYVNNPEKASTPWDFFIVQGKIYTPAELDALEKENQMRFSAEQRKLYTTVGGTPHLDNEHTVFGEVIAGMDVVERIAEVPVGEGDWPLEKVFIKKVTLVETPL